MDELLLQNPELQENLRCGACEFTTNRIAELHCHQQFHGYGGSYYFCHVSKTAYPRFELVSFGSQTEPLDFALVQALDGSSTNTNFSVVENSYMNNNKEEIEMPLGGFDFSRRAKSSSLQVNSRKKGKKAVVYKDFQTINKSKANKVSTRKQSEHTNDNNDTTVDDYDPGIENQIITVTVDQEQFNLTDPQAYNGGLNDSIIDDIDHDDHQIDGESQTLILDLETPTDHIVNDHNYEHPDLLDHQYLKSSRLHECVICDNVSYRRKFPLLRHFKKYHNNELPFKCDKCNKQLVSMADATRHSRLHKKDQYECPVCLKKFSSALTLVEHATNHTGDKPFKCKLCPNRYRKKLSLDMHVSSHSDKKLHICEFCGKAFANRTQLLKHIRCCVKKIECDICKKMFSDPCKLKVHMRKHTGERPYVCELCGCAFGYCSGLVRHKKFIHTKQKDFKCSFCEKRFVTKQSLERHERVHTAVKGHMCTFCGKPFREQWTLQVHTRIHTGEMPYPCDICGERFKHNVARRKHEAKCPMKNSNDFIHEHVTETVTEHVLV